MRVVLDTNVLLGAQRQMLITAARNRLYTLVLSEFILTEMRRVMQRINWNPEKGSAYLQLLISIAEMVDHRQITGGNYDVWLKDIDDYSVLATAIIGKADYLVTNNTKDFPPKQRFANITFITSDAFLRRIF